MASHHRRSLLWRFHQGNRCSSGRRSISVRHRTDFTESWSPTGGCLASLRRIAVVLRSEYSLGHSPFNEFLFAYVGEERSGLSLTVLSALARLGLDPWKEAARLSEMSEETATSALAATIAGLPEGNWRASDSRSIAARLMNSLPRRHSSSDQSPQSGTIENRPSKPGALNWLVWIALAATLVAMFWRPEF